MAKQGKANDGASFGQNLRHAREARNITLQEITASTKISSRALQALEGDQFDQLPGGIFNKGFVRAYARFVGLDEEKTVAAYMTAANVAAPETDMQVLSSQVSMDREQTHESWGMNAGAMVGLLAVIVALLLGGVWLKQHLQESKETATAQQQVASPVVSAPAPLSIPPPTAASDPNAANAGVADTAANGGSAAPNAAPIGSANAAPNGTPNTGPNPGAEAVAPVEISVSATARAWISVSSDGKTVEQLVLDPDKPEMRSRTYKAQDKLLLIVGNPSGVAVTYNGKPAGTLGAEGKRATITFTPQGMEKR